MRYFRIEDEVRDGVKDGVKRVRRAAAQLRDMPNLDIVTRGGGLTWETVAEQSGFRLQINSVTGHARILDSNDVRVAWGSEEAMRGKFEALCYVWRDRSRDDDELMDEIAALSAKPIAKPEPEILTPGDIIGIKRSIGYYHYGVYVGDDRVIHYADDLSDPEKEIVIHEAGMEEFLLGQKRFFILDFPDSRGVPQKIYMDEESDKKPVIDDIMKSMEGMEYRLYTPEETIARARSRIGESRYDLAFNNCEHFAIWCKTGMHESFQADSVLGAIRDILNIGIEVGF